MIFHENRLQADDSHAISYLFLKKLEKMSQNLSSAAVVIGALRVKSRSFTGRRYFRRFSTWSQAACTGLEGVGIGGLDLTWKITKNITLLSNTGQFSLKNHKAAKPAFNVRSSMARQRNAIYKCSFAGAFTGACCSGTYFNS